MFTVALSDDELAYLSKPVRGQGGFQDLLRALSSQREGFNQSFTEAQAERIIRYASQYGPGGFEDRLFGFAKKVAEAAGIEPPQERTKRAAPIGDIAKAVDVARQYWRMFLEGAAGVPEVQGEPVVEAVKFDSENRVFRVALSIPLPNLLTQVFRTGQTESKEVKYFVVDAETFDVLAMDGDDAQDAHE